MHPPSSNLKTTIDQDCFVRNADHLIDQFKDKMAKENKEVYISDVSDKHGNQYIDLVQKGGGVWGVALIGFTYVLEKMDVRFLRMAGTSAGAINTVLMSAMGDKSQEKSVRLLKMLANKDLFEFVDGHWMVKKMVEFLTKWKNPGKVIRSVALIYAALLVGSLLGLAFNADLNFSVEIGCFIVCFICVIMGVMAFAMLMMLRNRFNQSGLGLNPGETFLFWMQDELKNIKNQTNKDEPGSESSNMNPASKMTTEELIKIAEDVSTLGLHVVPSETQEYQNLNSGFSGGVTVISSEICTGNKIELPKMIDLFKQETVDPIEPEKLTITNPMNDAASLVRASMAIPFFFESFYVKNIVDGGKSLNNGPWYDFFRINPPKECRLVDGGVLSNFPIDIYVDSTVKCPRYPTIGIDLFDKSERSSNENSNTWSFLSFVGNIFNAARNHYDKAYIHKNKAQKDNIAEVDVGFINWLKFSMSKDEKLQLFLTGVSEAIEFLDRFLEDPAENKIYKPGHNVSQWRLTKQDRIQMFEDIKNNSNS